MAIYPIVNVRISPVRHLLLALTCDSLLISLSIVTVFPSAASGGGYGCHLYTASRACNACNSSLGPRGPYFTPRRRVICDS